MKNLNNESLKELLGNSEIDGEEAKCVVFMSNVLDIKRTQLVIQTLGNITKRNVAIGGCIGHLAHDSANALNKDLNDMLEGNLNLHHPTGASFESLGENL